MAIDKWLVNKLMKLFLRRYATTIIDTIVDVRQMAENNYHRETKSKMKACGSNVKLRPGVRVYFPENVVLGDHIVLNYDTIVMGQGGVTIGDFCVLGPKSMLVTVTHQAETLYYGNAVYQPITLATNVWIGAGAILLPGISVGENSVVGAGSVVTRDVEPNSVVAGVPAKKLKSINPNENLLDQTANGIRSGLLKPSVTS